MTIDEAQQEMIDVFCGKNRYSMRDLNKKAAALSIKLIEDHSEKPTTVSVIQNATDFCGAKMDGNEGELK